MKLAIETKSGFSLFVCFVHVNMFFFPAVKLGVYADWLTAGLTAFGTNSPGCCCLVVSEFKNKHDHLVRETVEMWSHFNGKIYIGQSEGFFKGPKLHRAVWSLIVDLFLSRWAWTQQIWKKSTLFLGAFKNTSGVKSRIHKDCWGRMGSESSYSSLREPRKRCQLFRHLGRLNGRFSSERLQICCWWSTTHKRAGGGGGIHEQSSDLQLLQRKWTFNRQIHYTCWLIHMHADTQTMPLLQPPLCMQGNMPAVALLLS